MRDSFILKDGDTWYLTGSTPPYWTGPCAGVRLFSSRDLLNWKFETWLIEASALPPDCFYNGRFWAPEIHAAHGRFWLTVNSGRVTPADPRGLAHHNIVLLVADRITGPYEPVTRTGPLGRGFKNDASLFTDDDGRSYAYASGGGLWQAEIDLAAGSLCGADDFARICSPRDPGLPDWMIGGIEGPFVVKRHGAYWMFFSAWTRGYEVGVLRAPSPLGPWMLCPRDPIFGTRKRRYREKQMAAGGYGHLQFPDTDDPFVETGHCAIFEGPDGRDWMCCHYLPQGTRVRSTEPVVEYDDAQPHLGFEPLEFRDGCFAVRGPTWTEQIVSW
jgi:xylan 1,4-beta-xylosidase